MPQDDQLFEMAYDLAQCSSGAGSTEKVNKETKAVAEEMLRTYGLYEFKDAYPSQLSGGMRQRAALIRTLAINPEILLLDEAFSALDYQTRLLVADEVKEIITSENKTAVLVTHDIAEAISIDRVVVLSKRPGTIKNIHEIKLTCEINTPLGRREAVEFHEYFNRIWKELDVHAEK